MRAKSSSEWLLDQKLTTKIVSPNFFSFGVFIRHALLLSIILYNSGFSIETHRLFIGSLCTRLELRRLTKLYEDTSTYEVCSPRSDAGRALRRNGQHGLTVEARNTPHCLHLREGKNRRYYGCWIYLTHRHVLLHCFANYSHYSNCRDPILKSCLSCLPKFEALSLTNIHTHSFVTCISSQRSSSHTCARTHARAPCTTRLSLLSVPFLGMPNLCVLVGPASSFIFGFYFFSIMYVYFGTTISKPLCASSTHHCFFHNSMLIPIN